MTTNDVPIIHGLTIGQIQAIIGNQALYIEKLTLDIKNRDELIDKLNSIIKELEEKKNG